MGIEELVIFLAESFEGRTWQDGLIGFFGGSFCINELIEAWTASGMKVRLSETYTRDFILDVIAHPEKVY